jgi:pimeloyl-ACP methyl ester carboxylesterase
MPQAKVNGIKLYYTEAGDGEPIIFVHEFAGDYRSWEAQVRYFSRRYRCIAYNARGYPPSEIPAAIAAYSHEQAGNDIAGIMHHLHIQRAHIVGASMGASAALQFGLHYPDMVLSLVLAGIGYGALAHQREQFAVQTQALADRIHQEGIASVTTDYALTPERLTFKRKDPKGWREFATQLAHHSSEGLVLTLRGGQATRPCFGELEHEFSRMNVPVLIITGDEDETSLESSLYLKRHIPAAGLCVLPKAGHALNLEEPMLFNATLQDFFTTVAAGKWELQQIETLYQSRPTVMTN